MNGCCFLKGPRNSLVAQQVKDPTVVPVQSLAQDLLPTIGAAKKKKKAPNHRMYSTEGTLM